MLYTIFFPFVMAIVIWFLCNSRRVNNTLVINVAVFSSIVTLVSVIFMIIQDKTYGVFGFDINGVGGLGLHFSYNGFKGVFALITAFAWFVTFLMTKEYMKNDTNVIRYIFYNLITLGSTLGIFFADDFFTLFFFFELMSLGSFMWVAHRQTKESAYASGTYLAISIAGGLAILMGIFILYNQFGTLSFSQLQSKGITPSGVNSSMLFVAAGCMFAGFGAKASAFPVHVWLPQSYTEAPAPATALLSAVLSKTGVFGIILVSIEVLPADGNWGMFIIMTGIVTMLVGGIRAVVSTNFKTTIAYSSMSQIGFILFGVGMQNILGEAAKVIEAHGEKPGEQVMEAYSMAVNGTLLHMLNHSLVKLVLFMIAGIIFMNIGSYELNKVRGFGRKKPFLMICFGLAAAGVSGIPLLNGYISKTLLHESLVEYMEILEDCGGYVQNTVNTMKTLEYLFLFAGGLTLCYMLKLFIVLFIEENSDTEQQKKYDENKSYASVYSKAGIALASLPVPFIGLLPQLTADKIAVYGQGFKLINMEMLEEPVHYFALSNLKGGLISIAAGIIVYLVVVRMLIYRNKKSEYVDIWPQWIDLEKYIYRAIFYKAIPTMLGITSRVMDSIVDTVVVVLRKTVYRDLSLPYELPEGNHFTHDLGVGMENIHRLNCSISKKECEKKNYEHKLALMRTDIVENLKIIESSLSFGLFMFCVGLVLTLIYLLVAIQ